MRRPRRPSFGSGDGSGTPGGFDQKRRTELLAEARRKRVAWVEEARGVDEGVDGARKRKEDEAAENGRKAESELERVRVFCRVFAHQIYVSFVVRLNFTIKQVSWAIKYYITAVCKVVRLLYPTAPDSSSWSSQG